MRAKTVHDNAALLIILILITTIVGCGVKAAPRPYASSVSKPVADLSAAWQDEAVLLTWTAPKTTEDERSFKELAGFIVFRADAPRSKDCMDCPPESWRLISEVVAEKNEVGKAFVFLDRNALPGKDYFYKIRVKNSWAETSLDSETIRIKPPGTSVDGIKHDKEGMLEVDVMNEGAAGGVPAK